MLHRILFDLGVAFVFLAMMSILVTAHEFGHYVFARMFGMSVEEFAIGFGKKPLWIYRQKHYQTPITEEQANLIEEGKLSAMTGGVQGFAKATSALEGESGDPGVVERTSNGPILHEKTDFTIRPIPLGGFVRIKGMMPDEEANETKVPGGFYSKPPVQRLLVLFAGPLFSVLAGILVLVPYNMFIGKDQWDHTPIVDMLSKEGAAEKGGMKVGDLIVSVNGNPVSDFYQVLQVVRESAGKTVAIDVLREGKPFALSIVPIADDSPTPVLGPDLEPTEEKKIQGKMGARWRSIKVPLAFGPAVVEAVSVPVTTVAGLVGGVIHPSTLKDQVGGPETMIQLTADATKDSLARVVFLAAVLSISVGIFNLLPFAPLDGGQMVMSFAELIRGGKRLSLKTQSIVISAGVTCIFAMVLSVLFIDFQRGRSGDGGAAKHSSAAKPASK